MADKAPVKYEPKYSGPGKSGVCICGHSWEDHHCGIVMNKEYYDQTGEGYVPQECEHYGCNESGGMMPGVGEEWVDHCHSYQDRGADA